MRVGGLIVRLGRGRSRPEPSGHVHRIAALRRALLTSDGASGTPLRVAAAGGDELPPPISSYVEKVRRASYQVTPGDIAALLDAGHTERAVLELTIAAALGAATERFEGALARMTDDG